MLKKYKLPDKSTFMTVTIPKGTILFRGIDFTKDTPDEYIREFYNVGYCLPPTKNVYFYPAPYAGIAVNPFNVYIIYTTNYDLELVLLTKPSNNFKLNSSEQDTQIETIFTICSNISSHDSCGNKMSSDDPCFTESFRTQFPNILGYIGLDANDVQQFKSHYTTLLKHKQYKKIKHILPSIIQNSRGLTGIPEIVLHPLHLRRKREVRFKHDFRTHIDYIPSIIQNRARYNYTPLLYITSDNSFTLNDLVDSKNIDKLMESPSFYYIVNNPTFDKIENIISQFLSDGYIIDGYRYKFQLDDRLGFFKIPEFTVANNKTKRNKHEEFLEIDYPYTDEEITSIIYPVDINLTNNDIDNLKDSYSIDIKESALNRHLKSLTRTYIFNKGNYEKKYRVSEVFGRPEFTHIKNIQKRRFTRKKRVV